MCVLLLLLYTQTPKHKYIYIIIIIPCKFFKPTLANGFSLESERQQVSSNLQDSSQYSGWLLLLSLLLLFVTPSEFFTPVY